MENKEELLKEVQALKEENRKLKEERKQGLVWEEYKEKNEFRDYKVTEEKEMEIASTPSNIEHLFFEGDNLLALRELQKTHKGKVDVIYIDPPYNTGNEFAYNDKMKSYEEGYSHSRWLSFMAKRLKLARELLTEDGVIFVSIDDNEQAQLKLLMDSIFGENNFISSMIWRKKATNGGKSNTGFGITVQHEYVMVYTKKQGKDVFDGIEPSEDLIKKYNNEDEYGKYRLVDLAGYGLSYTENLDYEIETPEGNKIRANDVMGVTYKARWRWSKEKLEREKDKIVWVSGKPKTKVYMDKEGLKVNPSSLIIDRDYLSNTSKNRDIENIFGKNVFSYPKPVRLIKHLLSIIKNKNAIVLDFFAGSGTTGHAVLELNKEDGGNRQFILCTNNEVSEEKVRNHFYEQGKIPKPNKTEFNKFKKANPILVLDFMKSDKYQELGIARSVTHKRLSKVIEGYTTPKGQEVGGLEGNTVKYFKTEPQEESNGK